MRGREKGETVTADGQLAESASDAERLLSVKDLTVRYQTSRGIVEAVDGVSLTVAPGEKVAIVGESGSGKSTAGSALLRILPRNAVIGSGEIWFQGRNLLELPERAMRPVRGNAIGRIPQDPLSSLNPVFSIGFQIAEAIRAHSKLPRKTLRERAAQALEEVGLPDPERQLRAYPHELSGGMRQRVLIAIAIINEPKILVADEPTTALDTTIQAQILDLLNRLVDERKMSLLLITHNLGVVREVCDRALVLYRGEVVESASVEALLRDPVHPYTRMLRAAADLQGTNPSNWQQQAVKEVPGTGSSGTGTKTSACRFLARCPLAESRCEIHPELRQVDVEWAVRCVVAGQATSSEGAAV